jgi:hypothetical protein
VQLDQHQFAEEKQGGGVSELALSSLLLASGSMEPGFFISRTHLLRHDHSSANSRHGDR